MYADAYGKVERPILTIDWGTIQTAASTVKGQCVDGLHSGGVWIISGTSACFFAAALPFFGGLQL